MLGMLDDAIAELRAAIGADRFDLALVATPASLATTPDVLLPAPTIQIFRKVGTRAAQAISKVVVALSANWSGGTLMETRLAMGSIAATPVRLPGVEALLEGAVLNANLADAAAELVTKTIVPIDDVRSTADYRRHVAGQVVRRILLDLAAAGEAGAAKGRFRPALR